MFRRTTPPRSTTSSWNISLTATQSLLLSSDWRCPSSPFSKSYKMNLWWMEFSISTLWVWCGGPPHILAVTGEAVRPRQRGRGGTVLQTQTQIQTQTQTSTQNKYKTNTKISTTKTKRERRWLYYYFSRGPLDKIPAFFLSISVLFIPYHSKTER